MGGGVLIALLGIVAILTPLVTGIALSIVLGALLVLGSLAHVANAFSVQGWSGSIWQVVLAAVYAVAGISLLANPIVGLTTLTILIVLYLLLDGIVEIVMGLRMGPGSGRSWIVVSGGISLLLAGLLWVGFPSTAAWAVGVLFGVNLLSTGIGLIYLGMIGRKPASTPPGEASGTGVQ